METVSKSDLAMLSAAELLLTLVRKYATESNTESRTEIARSIQVMGRTASHFGGFDGMKELHDATENLVGNDKSAGFIINNLWDGIAGWWA